MKCIFFIVIVVGVVGNHHEMTFNNPLVNFTDPPLLSLYQQSHDFKQEAYGHGGDADVRVCGLCIVLSHLVWEKSRICVQGVIKAVIVYPLSIYLWELIELGENIVGLLDLSCVSITTENGVRYSRVTCDRPEY